MNVFCDDIVAQNYDQFYESEKGRAVDRLISFPAFLLIVLKL
jgi:hypothetical protein